MQLERSCLKLRAWLPTCWLPHSFQVGRPVGIVFDSNLSFKAEITDLASRLRARVNVLRSISGLTWGATRSCLHLFYQQVIRSLIDYAAPALLTVSPSELSSRAGHKAYRKLIKPLNQVQMVSSKIIVGAVRRAKNAVVRREIGLPMIEDRIEYIGKLFLVSMASTVGCPLGYALGWHQPVPWT